MCEKDFNSIKVRLELIKSLYSGCKISHFNSIKVRLEHKGGDPEEFKQMNFNSIKVRLEHNGSVNEKRGNPFQFHKGAIRT